MKFVNILLLQNTCFSVNTQRIYNCWAVSNNPHIENTRLLGVEVAGTSDHFRAPQSRFRFFFHSPATILKGLNCYYYLCLLDTLEHRVLCRPICELV